jgi:hypothetical protein
MPGTIPALCSGGLACPLMRWLADPAARISASLTLSTDCGVLSGGGDITFRASLQEELARVFGVSGTNWADHSRHRWRPTGPASGHLLMGLGCSA